MEKYDIASPPNIFGAILSQNRKARKSKMYTRRKPCRLNTKHMSKWAERERVFQRAEYSSCLDGVIFADFGRLVYPTDFQRENELVLGYWAFLRVRTAGWATFGLNFIPPVRAGVQVKIRFWWHVNNGSEKYDWKDKWKSQPTNEWKIENVSVFTYQAYLLCNLVYVHVVRWVRRDII